MMRQRQELLALAAAVLVFAALFSVCKTVLSGAAFIELLVQLDHRDRLQVFYAGSGRFNEHDSVCSGIIAPGQLQKVRIPLHMAPVNKLRLDLGNQPGTVRLVKLTVVASLIGESVLWPEDIHRVFSTHSAEATVHLEQDNLAIQTGTDSYLVSTEPLLHPELLLLWGLPLLFALLAFSLLSQSECSGLALFADLHNKQPSLGENINALDGLRAVALLMVVADHTWGQFSGLGRSGVWIFMTLSGFLIAKPFIQQPERVFSLSSWQHFFLRRAKRILPVYYTYIVAVYLLSCRFEEALLHALFLKGNGHLWVVPQEMLFYLLTPPVILINTLLCRWRPWLGLLGLLALIIVANHFASTILLRGCLNEAVPFCFGVFLGGVLAAYVHSLWLQSSSAQFRQQAEPWAAGLVLALLLFFLLCSEQNLWGTGTLVFAQIYFPYFAAAAALLILAVLAAGQSPLLGFLSSLPLRAFSLVSFSVYIFHPLLLELIRKGAEQYWGIHHLTGPPLFFSTLLLSYLFACITYSLLERPFLRSA